MRNDALLCLGRRHLVAGRRAQEDLGARERVSKGERPWFQMLLANLVALAAILGWVAARLPTSVPANTPGSTAMSSLIIALTSLNCWPIASP